MPCETASPTWRCIRETLTQHRADCAAFTVEIESLLAGMEGLRGQLLRQGSALAQERRQAAKSLTAAQQAAAEAKDLKQALELRQAQLQAAQSEVERLKAQLARREESTGESTSPNDQLLAELERVSGELSESQAQRRLIAQQLDEARAEIQRLTAATVEVSACRQELAEARRQLAEATRESADAKAELAARQAQWIEQLRSSGQAGEASSDLSQQQFAELRQRLEQTIDACSRWAAAAAGASETRDELAALRSELSACLAASPSTATEARSAWERERGALETELELVRARAAELYESLSRQERGLGELRNELGGDIKQLRRLLESQAELLSTRPADAPRREPAAPPAASDESSAAEQSDPVLSSVMAQFARLQQDVAERRKKKKP